MKKMKEEYSHQHRRWYDKDPVLSEAVSAVLIFKNVNRKNRGE